jgi:hypothetical protein
MELKSRDLEELYKSRQVEEAGSPTAPHSASLFRSSLVFSNLDALVSLSLYVFMEASLHKYQ